MGSEHKIIIIPVWDLENDEVIEIEIGEDFLQEEDRFKKERELKQKEARRREHELERYDRN